MSLVSCIMAKMQGDMGASDCEDKAAVLSQKIKNATDQGSEIGKALSNITNQLDQATSSYREVESLKWMASNSQNPDAQNALGRAQQEENYIQQAVFGLQQQQIQLESQKKLMAAEEKELTAEQVKNDAMMKINQASAQKFGSMIDPAIKRFFGGGGQ